MSKNKLLWTFALMFVVIASLPIAYAQTFRESRLFFILINSAIVFVILFLLQSFLIAGKGDKEKTAVWVAIVVASLLIGFLYGKSGYIWEGPLGVFFDPKVLVNALIIAAVLYFVLGLLDKNKAFTPQSPQGQTGYGILLFLIAVIFAVKLGNQWIWDAATFIQFRNYLFGPEGILNVTRNPDKFFVFIGTFVLIAYFFNRYLMKDAGQSSLINYFLALIIAASTAQAGMGINAVIQLGEIIFWITISDAVSGVTRDDKFRFSLGALLVGWASFAITATNPEHRGIFGKLIGNFILIPLGIGGEAAPITGKEAGAITAGLLWANLGTFFVIGLIFAIMYWRGKEGGTTRWIGGGGLLVILGLIIFAALPYLGFTKWIVIPLLLLPIIFLFGGLGFGIGRAEGRGRMLREGITRLWIKILTRLRKNRATAKVVGDWIETRDPTLPDELPIVFKDLRIEIFTLMNFMLRHEIYKAKAARLDSIFKMFGDLQEGAERILGNRIPTVQDIHENMRQYIEGSNIIRRGDEWILEDPNRGYGFARQYILVYEIMVKLKTELETGLLKDLPRDPDTNTKDWVDNEKVNWLALRQGRMTQQYNRYKTAIERFKVVNRIRAYRNYFIDMYNLYGQYARGYGFAALHAKPQYWSVKLKTGNEGDNGVQRYIDWKSKRHLTTETRDIENLEPGTHNLVEVNLFGFSTSDINAIQIERRNADRADGSYTIRRYKKDDIVYLHLDPEYERPKFATILEFSLRDWQFYVEDMEIGHYHPYSKRAADYSGEIGKGYINFDAVKPERELRINDIAFDREALKNPSQFIYWGRKHYYDPGRESLRYEPVNPYPTLSMIGLWQFIKDVSEKLIKEPGVAKSFYDNYFKMRYDDLEKTPTGGPGQS